MFTHQHIALSPGDLTPASHWTSIMLHGYFLRLCCRLVTCLRCYVRYSIFCGSTSYYRLGRIGEDRKSAEYFDKESDGDVVVFQSCRGCGGLVRITDF
jgi:hypothetical protein